MPASVVQSSPPLRAGVLALTLQSERRWIANRNPWGAFAQRPPNWITRPPPTMSDLRRSRYG